jgi:predicted SprT family Zn-dependent metalloprotease
MLFTSLGHTRNESNLTDRPVEPTNLLRHSGNTYLSQTAKLKLNPQLLAYNDKEDFSHILALLLHRKQAVCPKSGHEPFSLVKSVQLFW